MELLQSEKATGKLRNLTRITESQHPGGKEHRLKTETKTLKAPQIEKVSMKSQNTYIEKYKILHKKGCNKRQEIYRDTEEMDGLVRKEIHYVDQHYL